MKKIYFALLFFAAIVPSFAAVTITGSLPNGLVKHPYSSTVNAIGGTKPYAWSVSAGTLPTGLTLISSTQTSATLGGTPTVAGTYTFTIQAIARTGGTGTQSYTVTITQQILSTQNLTDMWCRSVPDCPNIWDTWYNVGGGSSAFTSGTYTTSINPADTCLYRDSNGSIYKTTYTGFNNVIGNMTYSVTGTRNSITSGANTISNASTYSVYTAGNNSVTVGGTDTRVIAGAATHSYASTYSVNAAALHTIASPTVSFSGLVGIGTTSPTSKLHVVSTGTTSASYIQRNIDGAGNDAFSIYSSGQVKMVNPYNNTYIGDGAGLSTTTGNNNTGYGKNALASNTTGSFNLAIGEDALKSNTTGNYNEGHGLGSLFSNTTGLSNTALGDDAMRSNTVGSDNLACGRNSLYTNTSGVNNVAIGHSSMYTSNGSRNTGVGKFSGYAVTGSDNTAIGYGALNATTSGAFNVALGSFAGGFGLATGSNNVLIGYAAETNAIDLSNAIVLGANTTISCSDCARIGNDNMKVGIRTSTPAASLHIVGSAGSTFRMVDATQGNGKILVSDADGDLSYNTTEINTTAGDAATINATSGRFRKDNSGASFTLTNSYITANSIIILTQANAAVDATGTAFTVSAGSGSATITWIAAPTANFDMNFIVIN